MGNEWKTPDYRYGPEDSLGSMLRAFMEGNALKVDDVCNLLNIANEAFENHLNNKTDKPIPNLYRKDFEDLTGIDVDRWYIMFLKQKILGDQAKDHPELFERWRTYDELIESVRALSDIYAVPSSLRLIADQLSGVNRDNVSRWLTGYYRPGLEAVEQLLSQLMFDNFIQASGSDAIFKVTCRSLFDKTPQELFGVKDFRELVSQFLADFAGKNQETIAKLVGLSVYSITRLNRYAVKKDYIFTISLITTVIQHFILKIYPDNLSDYIKAAKEYAQQDGRARLVALSDPKPFSAQMVKPNQPPPSPAKPDDSAAPSPELKDILQPVVRPAAPSMSPVSVQKEIKKIPADAPDLQQALLDITEFAQKRLKQVSTKVEPSQAPAQMPANNNLPIGETINGVLHCLSDVNFPRTKATRLDPQHLQQLKQAIVGLRKVAVQLAGIEAQARFDILKAITAELDELWLAFHGCQDYDDLSGAMRFIKQQRSFITNLREGKELDR